MGEGLLEDNVADADEQKAELDHAAVTSFCDG